MDHVYQLALRLFYPPKDKRTFTAPAQVRFFPHALAALGVMLLWLTGLTVYVGLRP